VKNSIFLICAFWTLLAIETITQVLYNWSSNGVDTKIMLLPLAVVLFMFTVNINLSDRKVYVLLRKLSLIMFLSQRIFITLYNKYLSFSVFVKNSFLYFLLVLISTLIFSYLFIKLSEKFKILKNFY